MKIFISHQRADSQAAALIAERLRRVHNVESYLDVVDPSISDTGEALAEHVRDELGKCTELLAVVSEATASSWWVPWEIGVATEKEYALATYSNGQVKLPEYLKKWPYLRSHLDLDKYVLQAKALQASRVVMESLSTVTAKADVRRDALRNFYKNLRSDLGQ